MLAKSIQILRGKGYRIYREPYKLNIVGYRSRFIGSNRFDDEIHVFYTNDNGKWVYHIFRATTDPGQYWLDNPMHPQGTAFLKKGQYIDAYSIGLHRGVYSALVQTRPVTVIRNYERKGLFKWFESGVQDTGRFGINIHRARKQGVTRVIDNFSAGCLVFANASDFDRFMQILGQHRKRYGNSFTLTLVDFRDERRRNLQRIAWGTLLVTGGWLAFSLRQTRNNN
ncbi:hypothetical protein NBT05_02650 [Aquimarina sp. ERC-38]|uniref:hypothetical protein n=1 Tax=Aquimarina sp. ERC-38 TaxID=2949996 RepID=UPI00224870AE|nr:hypothetical protein [Aquimarina sp. ERC-38]UZO81381.1 hypothetical protein NBT05_02650 [Aquimarina sp. ERC-38]